MWWRRNERRTGGSREGAPEKREVGVEDGSGHVPEAAGEAAAERHGRGSEPGGKRNIVLSVSVGLDCKTNGG